MAQNEEDYRSFSEAGVANLLRPIFEAVEQLHLRGVVHRDICLAKIAIRIGRDSQANLQLHGFEHAVYLPPKNGQWTTPEQQAMVVVNRLTTAPEIKAGLEHGRPADVYGLGQIAYQLLCYTDGWEAQVLQPRVHCSNPEEEHDQLMNSSGSNFWQSQISAEVKDIIAQMVLTDPLQRPNIQGILLHSWF